MTSPEVAVLGYKWYEHPELRQFKAGWDRIDRECSTFFASLGYEKIPDSNAFRAVAPSDRRVALFAHQGFGKLFFSWLMHIPYPQFCVQFGLCHTGMTVVEFQDENGIVFPKLLTFSSDGHLYREGLPLDYNHKTKI